MKHVIMSVKLTGAFKREHVLWVLYHADLVRESTGIDADAARVCRGEVSARRALADTGRQTLQGVYDRANGSFGRA
jgi:hypothetical protein